MSSVESPSAELNGTQNHIGASLREERKSAVDRGKSWVFLVVLGEMGRDRRGLRCQATGRG